MDAAADAVLIIDGSGIVLNFNQAAENVLGYRASEVVGQNVKRLMPEGYARQHDGYIRHYLETGEARIIGIGRRVEALHRDGRRIPVELSVGEYSESGKLFFVGILRDLSERERYEEALRNSEAQLREREQELQVTLARAPIGILSIDMSGRIVHANHAACELLGYEEPALRRTPYLQLLHPDDIEITEKHRARLLDGAWNSFVLNNRYLHRDGSLVHVVLHCAIANDVDGNPERFVAQMVDRTDQVRAENDANEARERLARVDRISTMGEMASGIAHEINQPLAAISSYVQACRRRMESAHPDIERLRELMAKVDEQSLRAGKIVERIRALIRSQDTVRERSRLIDILADTLQLARADTNNRGITITECPGPDNLEVIVDSIQVQQVVLNLIRNAIDATEAVESPASAYHPPPGIEVGYRVDEGGDSARIWVRDHGAGVPPEVGEKLFEPFETTKSTGTGMGLSISRSIVNAHGGRIGYEDAGPGARFWFTLPLAVPGDRDD